MARKSLLPEHSADRSRNGAAYDRASRTFTSDSAWGWQKVAVKLLNTKPRARWAVAKGPMAALQLALADVGWQAQRPDRWIGQDGTEWSFQAAAPLDLGDLLHQLQADVRQSLWSKAANHDQGTEQIEQGADLTQLQRSLRCMRNEGHHTQAGALEAASCGAIYECEANEASTHPWIQASQHLCGRAIRAHCRGKDQMFWLRGLVPTA